MRKRLHEAMGEMPQRSTRAAVMRVARVIPSVAGAALIIAASNPVCAYTRAQCNAPYTGCLAKCGNRITRRGASYQQVQRDACGARQTRAEGVVTNNSSLSFPWVLVAGFAAALASSGSASAQPSFTSAVSPYAVNSPLLLVAKKKPIDKSCLMVCEKWGDDGCLKWVMKCKGDAGRGGSATRK